MSGKNMLLLETQRERASKLCLDSTYVLDAIKQAVDAGRLVLKPDLEISCNVGCQNDVLSVLHSFRSEYLRLVLESILKIKLDYKNDVQFAENLNAVAYKRIFHSPEISKNKRLVYTTGNWLTTEGKKAVEKHFLTVICQIFYLMEKCLVSQVIEDCSQMFKRDSQFESMNEVFSFVSRELISGKTLLPRVMESIGFKPSYISPNEEEIDDSVVDEKNKSQDLSELPKNSKVIEPISGFENNKENNERNFATFTRNKAVKSIVSEGSKEVSQVDIEKGTINVKSMVNRRLSELRDLGLVADESSQLELQASFFGKDCSENKQVGNLKVTNGNRVEQVFVTSYVECIEWQTNSETVFVPNNEKSKVCSIKLNNCEEFDSSKEANNEVFIKQESSNTSQIKSIAELLDNENSSQEIPIKQDEVSFDPLENTYDFDISIGESSFVQPLDDQLEGNEGVVHTLDKDIEEHLRQIYHTLSDVTNKTKKP